MAIITTLKRKFPDSLNYYLITNATGATVQPDGDKSTAGPCFEIRDIDHLYIASVRNFNRLNPAPLNKRQLKVPSTFNADRIPQSLYTEIRELVPNPTNSNPYCSRKSFNGRAYVSYTPSGYNSQPTFRLYSYGTKVLEVVFNLYTEPDPETGEIDYLLNPYVTIKRTWSGYSSTTAKHVKAFLELLNFSQICPINKKIWDNMKVEV